MSGPPLKWKRGASWPNNGEEFMMAESPRGRFTIARLDAHTDDAWYELRLDGTYVTADWVMRKLKDKAATLVNP